MEIPYMVIISVFIVPLLCYGWGFSRIINNKKCHCIYAAYFGSFCVFISMIKCMGIPENFDEFFVSKSPRSEHPLTTGELDEFTYFFLNYGYICYVSSWFMNNMVFLIFVPYRYYKDRLANASMIRRTQGNVNAAHGLLDIMYTTRPNVCYLLLIECKILTLALPFIILIYWSMHIVVSNDSKILFIYANPSSYIIFMSILCSDVMIGFMYLLDPYFYDPEQARQDLEQARNIHQD